MVNLQQGQVIKNYKELCIILDVEPTKGKGRQFHIREFERYCSYHKEGNKFIIDEVFQDPKPKIDNRVNGNNNKYGTLMDDLIIDILLHQECEITASFTDMFRTYIPLLSEEYSEGMINGYEYLQKKLDMSIGLINTYSNKTKDMIRTNFITALNRLQRQGLLSWTKEYVLNRSSLGQEFATEDESKLISKLEEETYSEMEIDKFMRIRQDINQEFRKRVISGLKEEDADIFSYWRVYHIVADDCIENIEATQPDIKELTNRYINSIHEKIMDYVIKPKDGSKPFKPYIAEKHVKNMLRLDLLFWEQYEGLEHGFTFDNQVLEIEYYYLENVFDVEKVKEKLPNNSEVLTTSPTLDTPTENIGTYDNQTGVYFPF
ncbi:MAG TPA: hypothetical protein DIW07_09035 [Lachnospiraceae bacterium]|nr:hypothetical protein [Lachnospiraceae bacterium]